jgi:putative NADH-flavin reductase
MSLTLALFGGSGRTGSQVIKAAVGRGVAVRTLVRSTASIVGPGDRVAQVVGPLTSEEAIRQTLRGSDAACLVFGPRPPYTDVFCADATRRIVSGMKALHITKVVCQTGAMIGDYDKNRTLAFQLMAGLFRHRRPVVYQDRLDQENIVRQSHLSWTLVKPPRLTDDTVSRHLRVGPEIRVGLMSSVSRVDLGRLLVEEVLHPRLEGAVVFMCG